MEKDFISEQVKKIAEALGLGIKHLAAHLDMPYKTVYNYSIGRSVPNAEFFCAILGKGISVEWFLTGHGAMMRGAGVSDSPAVYTVLPDEGVYAWQGDELVVIESPYDAALEPGEARSALGYVARVESGDCESGVGVCLWRHEDGGRFLVEVWIGELLALSVFVGSGRGLVGVFGVIWPVVRCMG